MYACLCMSDPCRINMIAMHCIQQRVVVFGCYGCCFEGGGVKYSDMQVRQCLPIDGSSDGGGGCVTVCLNNWDDWHHHDDDDAENIFTNVEITVVSLSLSLHLFKD